MIVPVLDLFGRSFAANPVRADHAIDQAELHRRHVEQRRDHVARMPAPPIVQILVDQRQHADQSIETQRVACGLIRPVLGEDDADIGVQPVMRKPAAMQDAVARKDRPIRRVAKIDDIVRPLLQRREPVAKQIGQRIKIPILRPQRTAVGAAHHSSIAESVIVQQIDQQLDQRGVRHARASLP